MGLYAISIILSIILYQLFKSCIFEYDEKEEKKKKIITICQICGYIIYSEKKEPKKPPKRNCCTLCCESIQNCCNETFCHLFSICDVCDCEPHCSCRNCEYDPRDYNKKKKCFVIVIKLKENLFGVINFLQMKHNKNYFLIC